MKRTVYIFLFPFAQLLAQSLGTPPQVLNSAGGSAKVNGYYYGYNIGEPVVGTAKTNPFTNYFTQGFLQPDYKTGNAFSAHYQVSDESCLNAADGAILISTANTTGNVSYSLSPSPSPADTTATILNLPPGTYTLFVKDDSTNRTLSHVFTINASSAACPVVAPHAFSPNHDGLNDTYIIDGIAEYPDNHVFFFNRWGQLIWDKAKYDNVKVVWQGKDNNGNEITIGTYFYVIDIQGRKPLKGWVEITK